MAINQTDFVTPLTGNIVIVNNGIFFSVQANADLNTNMEGPESFRIVLRNRANSNSIIQVSPPITINDVSFREVYTLTNTGDNLVLENSNILFELNTVNVSNANVLYYYTTGNASNSSFVEGNTGAFFLNSNGYANILLTTTDVPANTSISFNLVISKEPLGTAVATSNTITAIDVNLSYIQASGGTIITGGGFRTHVFTTSSSFIITSVGFPTNRTINYLVVAGGGSGGAPSPTASSGGGAGGLLNTTFTLTPTNIGTRTVTVGGGSTLNPPGLPVQGTPSVLGNPGNPLFVTATGGGGGANGQGGAAKNGGSGGGGSWNPVAPSVANAGTGTPGQGNPGGVGFRSDPAGNGAGGGGAGTAGVGDNRPAPSNNGGNGAPVTWIPASYGVAGPAPGRWFAGGGGGVAIGGALASNGTAGGGSANTGGGGQARSNGGSGIVAIRYPYA
jgi:hypothetical protein